MYSLLFYCPDLQRKVNLNCYAILFSLLGGLQYDNFGWDVVSTSVPAAYICEVDKRDLEDEMIAVRGFGEYSYLNDNYSL